MNEQLNTSSEMPVAARGLRQNNMEYRIPLQVWVAVLSFIRTSLCQGFSNAVTGPSFPVEISCEEILLWKQYSLQQFLTTGNLSIGRQIVTHCEVSAQEFTRTNISFKLCNDVTTSDDKFKVKSQAKFNDVCWFFNETYKIAKQWQILEENKQKWLAINSTALVYTYRAANNTFDTFTFYLKLISDEIKEIKRSAISRNLTEFFESSFLINISNSENRMWLRMHEIRRIIIKSSKFELYYIRTPLSSFIMIFGLLSNSIVMFLFSKHKSLRTSPNMLLLNLVVVDTLNLAVNLPFGYVVYLLSLETLVSFNSITCKLLIYFEQLCTGLCIWSLVTMSILRYKAVAPTFYKATYKFSRKQDILIYVSCVWIIGFVLAAPTAYAIGTIGGSCRNIVDRTFFTHWNLLLYSIVPVVIVAVFYTLTARRLAQSAKEMPGERHGQDVHRQARSRGAKVLVTLTVVFAICYPPLYIYNTLKYWDVVKVKNSSFRVEYIFYYLIYLNSAVNPVALFVSSGTFRDYFKFYFRKWFFRMRKLGSDSNVNQHIPRSSTSESLF